MGRRGPKPALTTADIAAAAIAVADAEGLGAVSMQRVAAEMGYTKMSLYRYFSDKSDLIATMVERAIGEAPDLSTTSWREALTTWSDELLTRHQRHAWTLEAVAIPGRAIGPNELTWLERALAALPPTLSGAERLDVVATIAGHARMIAGQGPAAEEQLGAAIEKALHVHPERYPAVRAAITDVAENGGGEDAFAFGLRRILDGLTVLIQGR
jgi:AcrR family transcriptional regulator